MNFHILYHGDVISENNSFSVEFDAPAVLHSISVYKMGEKPANDLIPNFISFSSSRPFKIDVRFRSLSSLNDTTYKLFTSLSGWDNGNQTHEEPFLAAKRITDKLIIEGSFTRLSLVVMGIFITSESVIPSLSSSIVVRSLAKSENRRNKQSSGFIDLSNRYFKTLFESNANETTQRTQAIFDNCIRSSSISTNDILELNSVFDVMLSRSLCFGTFPTIFADIHNSSRSLAESSPRSSCQVLCLLVTNYGKLNKANSDDFKNLFIRLSLLSLREYVYQPSGRKISDRVTRAFLKISENSSENERETSLTFAAIIISIMSENDKSTIQGYELLIEKCRSILSIIARLQEIPTSDCDSEIVHLEALMIELTVSCKKQLMAVDKAILDWSSGNSKRRGGLNVLEKLMHDIASNSTQTTATKMKNEDGNLLRSSIKNYKESQSARVSSIGSCLLNLIIPTFVIQLAIDQAPSSPACLSFLVAITCVPEIKLIVNQTELVLRSSCLNMHFGEVVLSLEEDCKLLNEIYFKESISSDGILSDCLYYLRYNFTVRDLVYSLSSYTQLLRYLSTQGSNLRILSSTFDVIDDLLNQLGIIVRKSDAYAGLVLEAMTASDLSFSKCIDICVAVFKSLSSDSRKSIEDQLVSGLHRMIESFGDLFEEMCTVCVCQSSWIGSKAGCRLIRSIFHECELQYGQSSRIWLDLMASRPTSLILKTCSDLVSNNARLVPDTVGNYCINEIETHLRVLSDDSVVDLSKLAVLQCLLLEELFEVLCSGQCFIHIEFAIAACSIALRVVKRFIDCRSLHVILVSRLRLASLRVVFVTVQCIMSDKCGLVFRQKQNEFVQTLVSSFQDLIKRDCAGDKKLAVLNSRSLCCIVSILKAFTFGLDNIPINYSIVQADGDGDILVPLKCAANLMKTEFPVTVYNEDRSHSIKNGKSLLNLYQRMDGVGLFSIDESPSKSVSVDDLRQIRLAIVGCCDYVNSCNAKSMPSIVSCIVQSVLLMTDYSTEEQLAESLVSGKVLCRSIYSSELYFSEYGESIQGFDAATLPFIAGEACFRRIFASHKRLQLLSMESSGCWSFESEANYQTCCGLTMSQFRKLSQSDNLNLADSYRRIQDYATSIKRLKRAINPTVGSSLEISDDHLDNDSLRSVSINGFGNKNHEISSALCQELNENGISLCVLPSVFMGVHFTVARYKQLFAMTCDTCLASTSTITPISIADDMRCVVALTMSENAELYRATWNEHRRFILNELWDWRLSNEWIDAFDADKIKPLMEGPASKETTSMSCFGTIQRSYMANSIVHTPDSFNSTMVGISETGIASCISLDSMLFDCVAASNRRLRLATLSIADKCCPALFHAVLCRVWKAIWTEYNSYLNGASHENTGFHSSLFSLVTTILNQLWELFKSGESVDDSMVLKIFDCLACCLFMRKFDCLDIVDDLLRVLEMFDCRNYVISQERLDFLFKGCLSYCEFYNYDIKISDELVNPVLLMSSLCNVSAVFRRYVTVRLVNSEDDSPNLLSSILLPMSSNLRTCIERLSDLFSTMSSFQLLSVASEVAVRTAILKITISEYLPRLCNTLAKGIVVGDKKGIELLALQVLGSRPSQRMDESLPDVERLVAEVELDIEPLYDDLYGDISTVAAPLEEVQNNVTVSLFDSDLANSVLEVDKFMNSLTSVTDCTSRISNSIFSTWLMRSQAEWNQLQSCVSYTTEVCSTLSSSLNNEGKRLALRDALASDGSNSKSADATKSKWNQIMTHLNIAQDDKDILDQIDRMVDSCVCEMFDSNDVIHASNFLLIVEQVALKVNQVGSAQNQNSALQRIVLCILIQKLACKVLEFAVTSSSMVSVLISDCDSSLSTNTDASFILDHIPAVYVLLLSNFNEYRCDPLSSYSLEKEKCKSEKTKMHVWEQLFSLLFDPKEEIMTETKLFNKTEALLNQVRDKMNARSLVFLNNEAAVSSAFVKKAEGDAFLTFKGTGPVLETKSSVESNESDEADFARKRPHEEVNSQIDPRPPHDFPTKRSRVIHPDDDRGNDEGAFRYGPATSNKDSRKPPADRERKGPSRFSQDNSHDDPRNRRR